MIESILPPVIQPYIKVNRLLFQTHIGVWSLQLIAIIDCCDTSRSACSVSYKEQFVYHTKPTRLSPACIQ